MKLLNEDIKILQLFFQISEKDKIKAAKKPIFPLSIRKNSPSSYYFINNPDGSIRWFFPTNNKNPIFLHLYNAQQWKGKLFKYLVSALAKLGIVWKTGTFKLKKVDCTIINELSKELNIQEYAVFTGTKGPNRKLLIALGENGSVKHFVKYPISEQSNKNIQNELVSIQILIKKSTWKYWKLPDVKALKKGILIENLNPKSNKKSSSNWTTVHTKALAEWYDVLAQKRVLATTLYKEKLDEILAEITDFQKTNSKKLTFNLKKKTELLQQLYQQIDWNQEVWTAWAHMDFTAWNMYQEPNRLLVYDWELAQAEMPILYDYFHFIYQNETLVKHNNQVGILAKIEENDELIQKLKEKFDINPHLYHQLYILYNTAYYLLLYAKQEELHQQVYWSLKVWEDALVMLTTTTKYSKETLHYV